MYILSFKSFEVSFKMSFVNSCKNSQVSYLKDFGTIWTNRNNKFSAVPFNLIIEVNCYKVTQPVIRIKSHVNAKYFFAIINIIIACFAWHRFANISGRTFRETFFPNVTSPETVKWSNSKMSGIFLKRLKKSLIWKIT